MARYTGPKTKKSRAYGQSLFGYDKAFEKRKYAPGQHGNSRKRKNKSEYGTQLMEKQKAKYTYGVLERQFRGIFEEANRKQGVTGEVLMQLLELRLDNAIYRLGIATTRDQARQFVTHKHILVNGKLVNIPSFRLRQGDVVSVRERSKTLEAIETALGKAGARPSWLQWNPEKMEGTVVEIPTRAEIKEDIKEQLIVELYSK